ncbi:hypothetical protein, partial [Pseudomonas viridiflava]
RAKMPSTQAAPGHFQRIALFAECIFDLPLTRGKLIGASLAGPNAFTRRLRWHGQTRPLLKDIDKLLLSIAQVRNEHGDAHGPSTTRISQVLRQLCAPI